jgi:hypothetical protein
MRIPVCMVGGSDESDTLLIKNEIEELLIKDIVDKIIYKDNYFLVYFREVNDCIDFRISRFIHMINQPTKYVMLHYKNSEMKVYTYIKKSPYKLLN